MRWWLRIVVTLVLGPILWGLVVTYVDGQLGAAFSQVILGVVQFFTLLVEGKFGTIPGLLNDGVHVLGTALTQVPAIIAALRPLYLTGTVPALAVIFVIFMPLGYVLRRLGLDLLIVILAPLAGWLVPLAVAPLLTGSFERDVLSNVGLAVCYGLVWGLTKREPRESRRVVTAKSASAS